MVRVVTERSTPPDRVVGDRDVAPAAGPLLVVRREVVQRGRVRARDRELEPSLAVQPVRVGHDRQQLEGELAEVLRSPLQELIRAATDSLCQQVGEPEVLGREDGEPARLRRLRRDATGRARAGERRAALRRWRDRRAAPSAALRAGCARRATRSVRPARHERAPAGRCACRADPSVPRCRRSARTFATCRRSAPARRLSFARLEGPGERPRAGRSEQPAAVSP